MSCCWGVSEYACGSYRCELAPHSYFVIMYNAAFCFQDFVLKKLLAKKKVTNIGVAELKIAAILIVAMALSVTGMVTYIFADMGVLVEGAAFITCVGSGGSNCSQLKDRLNIISMTLPATSTLLSLLPVVMILFACDVKTFKNVTRALSTGTQNN